MTDFVGFKLEKFANIPFSVSDRYSNVYFGSSQEIKRVIYFSDKDYFLDYEKIQDSLYTKLRNLPWIKRVVSVLYQEAHAISEILDHAMPSRLFKVLETGADGNYSVLVNLKDLDLSV